MLERGAYGDLLDYYYSIGSALPEDKLILYRACKAMDEDERSAVDSVLSKFFTLQEGRYHNAKADSEISRMNEYSSAQRSRSLLGVEARRTVKHQGNGAWWKTEDAIREKGAEVGLSAQRGETWQSFKDRIFEKLGQANA